MHSPRQSLLVCGLLLTMISRGQAQAPSPATPPTTTTPATTTLATTIPATTTPTTTTPTTTTPEIVPPTTTPPTLPTTSGSVPSPTTPTETSSGTAAPAGPNPTVVTPPETPLPGRTQAYTNDPTIDVNNSVFLDNADSLEATKAYQWTAKGNVRVRYQGYTLTSDQVDVDTDRGTATFTGNVHLLSPDGQTVDTGPNGLLRINLRRGTYSVANVRTTIAPEQSQVGLILPLFVTGGVIRGRPGFIDARNGDFTTCDFIEPHYSFGARELYIIPGRRLVGRTVSLYRKGHRVFTIPYIVVPLNQRLARQTLFPVVGQTPDEGYFIKFAIGYALTTRLPGILRVEEFQKKGTGLGFDQDYGDSARPSRGSGVLTLYRLFDQSRGVEDINGSLNHTQQFGTVHLSLNSQFQQNSYYAGLEKSQSQNTTLTLTRNVGNLNSSLLTTLTQNSYGAGLSQTVTSSLDQTFSPTATQQLHTRFDYSQINSPGFSGFGGQDTETLDSNLDYISHGKLFDLELLATKYNQLHSSGESSQFFGGLQRLPEFRIATDAARSSILKRLLTPNTHLDLSLGAFDEPSSQTNSERARFNLDLGQTTKKITSHTDFQYGGSFQQGFYGDNTAQYVLNGQTGFRIRIGRQSTLGTTYTYLRPYGFTPFQLDYTGNTNLAGLNLAVQESRAFQLTVGTGYDFNRLHSQYGFRATPFQTVAGQVVYTPLSFFRFRTTASYDLNNNRLVDLTNALGIRGGNLLSVNFSGRYDPVLKRYTTINGDVNLPFFRDQREDAGYRLRAIGGYNGITSRFDYKGLSLTRSWHDYELSLIYQDTPNGLRPGSSFLFNFRLKAFPAYEPFATGQYGQALDTGIGQTL